MLFLEGTKHWWVNVWPFFEFYATHTYACNKLVLGHYGHEDIVDDLLKRGADVNQVDIDGWTALHYACHNGTLKI